VLAKQQKCFPSELFGLDTMPAMNEKSENHLNTALFVYVLLDVFAYGWLRAKIHWVAPVFAFVPILLGGWSCLVARHHYQANRETKSIPYRRLTSGDYYRWFFLLWAGWSPLATQYELGFFFAAAAGIATLILAVVIAGVEAYRLRELTPLVIGMCFFSYCLLSWLRTGFCYHYGVPIIGHFFERPEYSARYMVTASRASSDYVRSGPDLRVVADIRVGGRSETYDAGEDRFGQTISETVTYRDVWVKRLHISPSQVVTIDEQDEPLSLGESVFVTDTRGTNWYITLKNEPVP
jgi:hypothetical protein